jgi:hypothetical protein
MHSSRWLARAVVILGLLVPGLCRALAPLPVPPPDENDRFHVVLPRPGWGGKIDLKWNGPPLLAATVAGEPKRFVKSWNAVPGRRRTRIWVANVEGWEFPAQASFEVLRSTRQYPDGRWTFRLEDAKAAPVSRLGVELYTWEFESTRPGNYTVEVLGSSWMEQTEAVEVQVGGRVRTGQLDFTTSTAVVGSKTIGRLRIAQAGPQTIRLIVGEPGRIRLGRAMGVVLRPAPEGPRNRPGSDGEYLLESGTAALQGMGLGFSEVAGAKRVSGWTEPGAALGWEYDDVKPGTYAVHIGWRAWGGAPEHLEVETLRQKVRIVPEATGGEVRWVQAGDITVQRMADIPLVLRASGRISGKNWEVVGVRLVPRSPVGSVNAGGAAPAGR